MGWGTREFRALASIGRNRSSLSPCHADPPTNKLQNGDNLGVAILPLYIRVSEGMARMAFGPRPFVARTRPQRVHHSHQAV